MFKRAFTLVELLVSLVIIALLMAFLLPALSQAKDSAMQTKCLSNLRQNNIAWQMYFDQDENVPVSEKTNRLNVRWLWGGITEGIDNSVFDDFELRAERSLNQFFPEQKVEDYFRCPLDEGLTYADTGEEAIWHNLQDQPSVVGVLGTSYFANDWLYCEIGSDGGYNGSTPYGDGDAYTTRNKRYLVVTSPSEFILLGDASLMDAGRYTPEEQLDKNILKGNWHGKERNAFGFLDGSVRQKIVGVFPWGEYNWFLDKRKHGVNSQRRVYAD